MKDNITYIVGLIILVIISCGKQEFNIEIPNFNFPKTIVFEDSLSAYNIFQDDLADLKPTNGYELLELSSVLFTDYSHKQRLVRIPVGTQMTKSNDGTINFPDGTILTKTFFYYKDERDTTLGKKVVETRLEIKENDMWNVATYIWNENQTDAVLELDGSDTPISWIDENGIGRSTIYHIPTENECMTCHQSNSTMTPIGPTLRNLNRIVERNGNVINQLTYLQNEGILNSFPIDQVGHIVDYNNSNASLEERGRAYLAMNCAHCHNPNAWDIPADLNFDFRYETILNNTGIRFGRDKIRNNVSSQQMPFIGTTMLDEEGVNLIVEFLDNL